MSTATLRVLADGTTTFGIRRASEIEGRRMRARDVAGEQRPWRRCELARAYDLPLGTATGRLPNSPAELGAPIYQWLTEVAAWRRRMAAASLGRSAVCTVTMVRCASNSRANRRASCFGAPMLTSTLKRP